MPERDRKNAECEKNAKNGRGTVYMNYAITESGDRHGEMVETPPPGKIKLNVERYSCGESMCVCAYVCICIDKSICSTEYIYIVHIYIYDICMLSIVTRNSAIKESLAEMCKSFRNTEHDGFFSNKITIGAVDFRANKTIVAARC